MRLAVILPVLSSLLVMSVVSACGEPQPPPKTAQKDDGIPANSLSDARLHGEEEKPKAGEPSEAPGEPAADPTQPYTTKMGEAPDEPGAGGAGKSATKGAAKGGAAKGGGPGGGESSGTGGKGAVSRAECDRVMDRYLELEIAKNPQLKDVPPEVIEQAKQMARQKHGEAPCTATRSQYSCAMAASSTTAWQRCMK